MTELWRRCVAFFRRDSMDRELDEELRFHVAMKARETGDRAAARRAVGNSLLVRERGRDAWGWRWLDELLQDLRYALRGMSRSPGFALAAILTLALGIGANCLMFSVADATVFRPFAFRDPGRLAYLWSRTPDADLLFSSVGNYLDWRAQNSVFEDLGAYGLYGSLDLNDRDLAGGVYAERVSCTRASASLFHVLGVQAEVGRTFLPEEELTGHDGVMLISDRLWRSRFGADPKVVGSAISGAAHDGSPAAFTIVGVLPPSMEATQRYSDLWIPLLRDGSDAHLWGGGGLSVVGRLKPGVSFRSADASLQTMVANLRDAHPKSNRDLRIFMLSYHDELIRNSRAQTVLLLAAVALVLLIACMNVANLMLARGAERVKELSIRAAVGAGRRRLFRQLLTESLALGILGGAAGIGLAYASVRAIRALLPIDTLRRDSVAVNGKVLALTLIVSLATGLLFGLLPAWRASRARIQPGLFGILKGAHERTLWRSGLIVAEIAMALILVTGAGLMVNSFVRLISKDLGFDRRDLFEVGANLPWTKYKTPAERMPVERVILARLRSLPGVRGASIGDSGEFGSIERRYFRANPDQTQELTWVQTVMPGYFDVMRIGLLRGRAFTARDDSTLHRVAIVNQAVAQQLWPGQDPLGKSILVQIGKTESLCEVVGLVGNSVGMRLNELGAPLVYFPQAQDTGVSVLDIVLRLEPGLPAANLVPAIRAELAAVDPLLVVDSARTMQSLIDGQLAQPRFLTIVLGIFAALALGLTITGIVGVVAYLVRARTYEFGVRMALGAKPGDVLAMICAYGGRLAAAGILLGIGGSLALTRLLASYLYEVKPSDPATFAGVVAVVLVSAMAACYAPARRAMRIDPARALRHD